MSTLAANQNFLPQRFFDNWDLGFNLAWELDFWGRFRREIESAADVLDASVFNYDDVIVTLLGDVGSTYVEMRTLQQQLQYVHDNIAIQTESLDIAQARFRGGLTSELDVRTGHQHFGANRGTNSAAQQATAGGERSAVRAAGHSDAGFDKMPGRQANSRRIARRRGGHSLRFADPPA